VGVRLVHEPATLEGHARYRVAGAPYPGIVHEPHGRVSGGLYRGLDGEHLRRLDEFEGALYRRERVELRLANGETVTAWTYVVPDESRSLLSSESWDEASYLERDHREFLDRARSEESR
jgi:gamma-glutamylcyclotransferase (GGCT)/AIG2-like uncharacterized protein YtfP